MLTNQKCSTQSKVNDLSTLVMPITWTHENVSRLFLVTLAVHHIHMDYKQIAQAFGGDATPRAIEEKMKKLRKEARGFSDGSTDSFPITRRGRGGGQVGFKAVACTPGRRRGRKPKHLKELEMQQAQQKQACMEAGDDEEIRQSCLPETPPYGDLMADHLLKKAQADKLKTEEQESPDNILFHHNYQNEDDEELPIRSVPEQIHYENIEKYEVNDHENADPQHYDDGDDFDEKVDPVLRYQTLENDNHTTYQTQVYDTYPQNVMSVHDGLTSQRQSDYLMPHFQSYQYPAAYMLYNETAVEESYDTDKCHEYKESKMSVTQDHPIIRVHDLDDFSHIEEDLKSEGYQTTLAGPESFQIPF